MSPIAPDSEALEFLPLFADQTEDAIRARWEAWANEGLSPDDVDEWVDTREGNFWNIATAPGVREVARVYDLMGSEFPAAAMPLWSWGEYLDDLGVGVSLERNAAVPATGEVTFTAPEGTVIDAGTRVGMEGTEEETQGKEYEVSAGGVVDVSGELTLPVEAVTAGEAGNAPAGAVTLPLTPLAVASIANADAIAGGADVENDELLRARLLAAHEGKGPGTVRDYVRWSLAYGNGIARVTVIPLFDGPGTVLVVILDANGDPLPAGVVDGLQAFLDPVAGMAKGEAPVGAQVTVTTAATVPVDFDATLEFEDGYSLDGTGGTVAMRAPIEAVVADEIGKAAPGGEVVLQRVAGRIATMTGVHDIGGVELNGVAANVALTSDPAQVAEADTITLTEGAVP